MTMNNAGLPLVIVEGNLTADPELKFTNSGKAVASFTIASTDRKFNKQSNEWEDGDSMFLRCTAWEDMAQNIAASLRKGHAVIARVRIRQREYQTREGEKRTSVEGTVDTIGPKLDRQTASVSKAGSGGAQQGAAAGPAGGGWAPQPQAGPPQYATTPGGGQPAAGAAWSNPGADFDDTEAPF